MDLPEWRPAMLAADQAGRGMSLDDQDPNHAEVEVTTLRERQASQRALARLPLVASMILLLIAGCALKGPRPTPTKTVEELLVDQGRTVYGDYCITCHGETGSGLAEARTRFPETHQRCERCHARSSPPVPEFSGDSFSIGEPPDLRALSSAGKFRSRKEVYDFIRVTMPRWAPGSLSDGKYLALSHYLWHEIAGAPVATERQEIDGVEGPTEVP